MRRIRKEISSPAMVVALVALIVALAGTGMASPVANTAAGVGKSVKRALKLSKRANSKADEALRLAKRADKNASKVQSQATQGVAGPAGPPGPKGADGVSASVGSGYDEKTNVSVSSSTYADAGGPKVDLQVDPIPGTSDGLIEVAASVEANIATDQTVLVNLFEDENIIQQSICRDNYALIEASNIGSDARFVTSPSSGCGDFTFRQLSPTANMSAPGVVLYRIPLADTGKHTFSLRYVAQPNQPPVTLDKVTLFVRAAS